MKYILVNINDFLAFDFAAAIKALVQLGASQMRVLRSFSTATSVLPLSRTLRQYAKAFEMGGLNEKDLCEALTHLFSGADVSQLALTNAWKQSIGIPNYLDTYLKTLLQIQEERKDLKFIFLGSFDALLYERLQDYTIISDSRLECFFSFNVQKSGHELLKEALRILSQKEPDEIIALRKVKRSKPNWWPLSFLWAPLESWRYLNWFSAYRAETNILQKYNTTMQEWPENPEALQAQLRLHEVIKHAIYSTGSPLRGAKVRSLEFEPSSGPEIFKTKEVMKRRFGQ